MQPNAGSYHKSIQKTHFYKHFNKIHYLIVYPLLKTFSHIDKVHIFKTYIIYII